MSYDKVNIDGLDDMAGPSGLESQEARFPRTALNAERIGLAHYKVKPGERLEFGHRHRSMEEAYVVLGGSGTFRVDEETFEVAVHDVVRVSPESWRGWEAGPDGHGAARDRRARRGRRRERDGHGVVAARLSAAHHAGRRGRDSNPRTRLTPVTRFPVVPVQPLRHLSRVERRKG